MFSCFKKKLLAAAKKISNFLNISKKILYLSLDIVATSLIGIGGAWLTSKGIDYYSIYLELTLSGLKDFILSPIFFILFGLVLYSFSKLIGVQYTDDILEKNIALEDRNTTLEGINKNLEKQMRGITEDNSLLKKKIEIYISELVKTWLSTSLHTLGINKSHIRATVYYHKNDAFHYVGRFSSNSIIAEVRTNKVILNGGVLSKAWELSTYMDLQECPIYENSIDEYVKYQSEKYGFTEEKVNNLTMKPCQYYARTITYRFVAIGVIVFESSKRTLTESKVKAIEKHCSSNEGNLINYIEKVKEYSTMVAQQSVNNADISDKDVETQFMNELEGKLNETK